MLSVPDHGLLAANLNHFSVPMFAAERPDASESFRYVCVNAAHSRISALETKAIYGRRVQDVFPPTDADAVNRRYEMGISSNMVTSYRETLMIKDRLTTWDTTLQKVEMADGRQRLVGTALAVNFADRAQASSDLEYYTARAQMQIGQIQSFLNMLQDQPEVPDHLRNGAEMTERLTCALQELLSDLRMTAPTQQTRTVSDPATLRVVE